MTGPNPPDFGAASDGDGDRNMIMGPNLFVTPSDSLALLAANAHLAPGYAGGLRGIARSMPTSRAADRVAAKLGIPGFETPPAGSSSATCSMPVRPRCAARRVRAPAPTMSGRRTACGRCCCGSTSWPRATSRSSEIVRQHWREFGRDYYTRHDYEDIDTATADAMMADLRAALPRLPGTRFGDAEVQTG